jgi:hypothetical protein
MKQDRGATSARPDGRQPTWKLICTSRKRANCGAPFPLSVAHEAVATVATRLVLEFCGAAPGAPQKFGILWRMRTSAPTCTHAPQNLAVDFVAHLLSCATEYL